MGRAEPGCELSQLGVREVEQGGCGAAGDPGPTVRQAGRAECCSELSWQAGLAVKWQQIKVSRFPSFSSLPFSAPKMSQVVSWPSRLACWQLLAAGHTGARERVLGAGTRPRTCHGLLSMHEELGGCGAASPSMWGETVCAPVLEGGRCGSRSQGLNPGHWMWDAGG